MLPTFTSLLKRVHRMKGFFSKLKEKFQADDEVLQESDEGGYVELSSDSGMDKAKVMVRPFMLNDFEGIKPILDSLREGHTVALINIRPLKDKDLVELKRAINKLKKTCDAIEGDIAGFGENWIAAVPSFAQIYRGKRQVQEKEQTAQVTEYDDD